MARFVAALLVVCAAVACSSSSRAGAGASCSGDGDCEARLSCRGLATFSGDGGCSDGPRACTKACATDVDCASALGVKYRCFEGCAAGSGTCGATP